LSVFVSYRRDEAADAVDLIRQSLTARRSHLRVFVDVHSIAGGRDFAGEIVRELEGAGACLAVIGPGWVENVNRRRRLEETGDYVRLELEAALGRGIPVLPVLIHGASLPAERDLPESLWPLLRRQAIALTRDYWSAGIERLVSGLDEIGGIARGSLVDGQRAADLPLGTDPRRANLPLAAWPLLGRQRELARIRELVLDGVRLITLTGPGGSGKTRLALEAAGEMSDEFADGVFFVALAPLRDTTAVAGTVAEAVGLQPDDDAAAWLQPRAALLVLDNLEHLAGVETVVATLVVGKTVVLCTSRAALRLAAERELPVEPLDERAAVDLFISRAAAAGRDVEADPTVTAVCRRLDNLPLALELAAARSKLLSPTVLLKRLDAALPLLSGAASDRPERQRTLRATIEWSHDLLEPDVQRAFRRLSVFRGSFTLEGAEAVAGANLDEVAALLDQSLLKTLGEERFFMLETIREYAREQLEAVGEADDYALRHAHHYLAQLEKNGPGDRGQGRFAWFAAEEDNLRAMLDRLAAVPPEAASACQLLWPHWWGRGAYMEARQRLREVLDTRLSDDRRARLLTLLAKAEEEVDQMDAAESASDKAVAMAEALGSDDLLADALRQSAWVKARRGRKDEAVQLIGRAADLAADLDYNTRSSGMHDLAALLGEAGRGDEAREVFQQTMQLAREHGDTAMAISILVQTGFIDLHEHRFDEARAHFSSALSENAEVHHHGANVYGRWGLGYALLGLGQRSDAGASLADGLDLVLGAPQTVQSHLELIASGVAHAAEPADARPAARLRGAIASMRERRGHHDDPRNVDIERFFDQSLIDALGEEAWAHEQAAAADMAREEMIQLARSLAAAPLPGGAPSG
jgi:predicted ATPase